MLQKVRDNASGFLVKIILWGLVAAFVGTIFLVWGYGDAKGQAPVAKVGDYVITKGDYQLRYDRMLRQMEGKLTRDMIKSLNLDKRILNQMVAEKLVLITARETGFIVSDKEVEDSIANNPDFQTNGVFDKHKYLAILRGSRMNPGEFENTLRDDITVKKLVQFVGDMVQVTEDEIVDEYNRKNGKVKIAYLAIADSDQAAAVNVAEKQIKEYFEKNKQAFMRPEGREIESLFSDPGNMVKTVDVPSSEIKDYYESHIDDYRQEEKVGASHILIKVPQGATPDEEKKLREKAEGILEEIRNGADFAVTAKKHSDGPSAVKGGELGEFGRGTMIKEFEEALFKLKPGEVSDIVKTEFGFHIIKMESHKKAFQKKLEDVKNEIRKILAKSEAEEIARKKLNDAVRGDKKTADWKEIAAGNGFTYLKRTVYRGEPVEPGVDLSKLVNRAFDMRPGSSTTAIKAGKGFYAIRLIQKVPPKQKTLAEVKDKIIKRIRSEEGARLAREKALAILSKLEEGSTTIAKEAKKLGVKSVETEPFTIEDTSKEAASIPHDLRQAAFMIKRGDAERIYSSGKHYVFKVVDRQEADPGAYKDARGEIRKKLLLNKRTQVVEDWQNSLRRKAESNGLIEIRENLL